MHASDTGLLTFDGCRVPAENLLGEENKGFYYVMERLDVERYVAVAALVSSCQQALEDAVRYAQERHIFNTTLSQLQVTRHRLAQLQTKIEAARQLIYYTGWLYDAAKTNGKGAQFDTSTSFTFVLGAGQVIAGWDQGVVGMKVGGTRRLTIPPELAYRDRSPGGGIPANATLVFDVTLLSVQ